MSYPGSLFLCKTIHPSQNINTAVLTINEKAALCKEQLFHLYTYSL